jgi:hypothetical protein
LGQYRRDIVNALNAHGGNVPDFPSYLNAYVAPSNRSRLDCDLWFAERFFFSVNPSERSAFISKLVSHGALDNMEARFFDVEEGKAPEGWDATDVFSFDNPIQPGFMVTGNAFSLIPVFDTPLNQGVIVGRKAGFIDSCDSELGDRATGRLQSPSFAITGDIITLLVAGGNDPLASVNLIVNGRQVASSTGCQSEIMSRRVWNVSRFKGARGVIEIVDSLTGGWSHIVVDQIQQWSLQK